MELPEKERAARGWAVHRSACARRVIIGPGLLLKILKDVDRKKEDLE